MIGDFINTYPVTNQIPISTDINGDIYNTTGYKEGYRLNSSGAEVEAVDFTITGYIPFTLGDTIRFWSYSGYEGSNGGIYFFDSSHTIIGRASYSNASYYTSGAFVDFGISKWTPSASEYNNITGVQMNLTNTAYIRICGRPYEGASQANPPSRWIATINESWTFRTGEWIGGGMTSSLTSFEHHYTFPMTERHQQSQSTTDTVELPLPQEAKDIIAQQYFNRSLNICIVTQVMPTEYHGFVSLILRNNFVTFKNSSGVVFTGCKHSFQYLSSNLSSITTTILQNTDSPLSSGLFVFNHYYSPRVSSAGKIYLQGARNYMSWEAGNWDIYIRYVDKDDTIYNYFDKSSSDWLVNKRINSSNNIVDQNGIDITNFIECNKYDIIRFKNLDIYSDISGAYYSRLIVYDSSQNILEVINPQNTTVFVTQNGVTTLKFQDSNISSSVWDTMAYIRFCCVQNPDTPVLTINQMLQ